MTVPVAGLARVGVVAVVAAGVVVAATQVEGAVAVAPPAPTRATSSSSAPVTSASLLCPGPELVGVPGVDDIPVAAGVTAVTAPRQVVGKTASGDGKVTLRGMPGDGLGSATIRGAAARTDVGKAAGVEVDADGSLAPGVAAAQSWLRPAGDQRGLAAAACSTPGADLWLLAGGGSPGRQERLVLTNPGGNAVTVDVTVHGPDGLVESGAGQGIVVPAHGRTAFLVDTIAPDVASPAIHVVAQGGVVSAVVNDLWLDGVRAAGTDDASPTAAPSRDQVVPAVAVGGRAILRVAVPGSSEAVVQARLLTKDGPRALPAGAVVRVAGGAVRDIDLSKAAPGYYGVQVKADQPVVAGAFIERAAPGKPSDFAWTASTAPISGVAGLPLAAPAGAGSAVMTHSLSLVATGDPAVAEVVTVDAAGRTESRQVSVAADGVAAASLVNATSVWVRKVAGDGQLRAGVLTWTYDSNGTLITAVPLRDAPLRTKTVTLREAPRP